MKRTFHALCVLFSMVMGLASCLGSGNDEATYYDDVAIKAFTLGTLNKYQTLTSSTGADSVVKTTFTGSLYPMSIDHLNCRIFNTDSLPLGTDAAHVVFTFTTSNNAVVGVQALDTTSDSLWHAVTSGTDSLDFSAPRALRVFSTDGMNYRDYTVTLNVRRSEAGFVWTKMAAGTTVPSTDWTAWSFALSDDGQQLLASTDGGDTWTVEMLDTDAYYLPRNPVFATWPLDNGLVYALMVGEYAGDADHVMGRENTSMLVWRRLIDTARPSASSWVYMTQAPDNNYLLPAKERYWLAPLAGGDVTRVLAVASDGTMRVSRDQGITWKTDADLQLPSGFSGSVGYATTDAEGGVWLQESESGQVWYGRQND